MFNSKGKVNMSKEPITAVMERTHVQRQERFIRLFLYTSPNFPWLRENKDLTRRVADICAQVVNEVMPEQVTSESYAHYVDAPIESESLGGIEVEVQRPYTIHNLLYERLMHDEAIKQQMPANQKPPINAEFRYRQIAHRVGEAHRYFLQEQLKKQSTFQ